MKYKYTETKTIVKQIEILSCPFCGSDNVQPIHIEGNWGYSASQDYVRCLNCKATGGKIEDSNCGNHMHEAIDKWNKRVIK